MPHHTHILAQREGCISWCILFIIDFVNPFYAIDPLGLILNDKTYIKITTYLCLSDQERHSFWHESK